MYHLAQLSIIVLLFASDILPPPKPLPDVRLVDQNESVFQLNSLKGEYSFISFFYTHCPTESACPTTVSLTKNLARHLEKSPAKTPVNFLLVTLDPDRDSPVEMKKFASLRGVTDRRIRLVTGHKDDLQTLKSALEVAAEALSDGDFYHDSVSFLVDPKLVPIRKFHDNAWNPAEVFQGL